MPVCVALRRQGLARRRCPRSPRRDTGVLREQEMLLPLRFGCPGRLRGKGRGAGPSGAGVSSDDPRSVHQALRGKAAAFGNKPVALAG